MYAKYHILQKENLTTVHINDTIKETLNKMNEDDFLSLPVLDENEDFIGTVRKDKIYVHYFNNEFNDKEEFLNKNIAAILNTDYKIINSNTTIEETSYLLGEAKTPFLPVFENNKFIGILTHKSIFDAFHEVFGHENGIRLALYTSDGNKKIERLSKAVRKSGGSIITIATRPAKVMNIYKIVVRVSNCDMDKLEEKLKKEGFKIDSINY